MIILCSACGSENKNNDTFCTNCGAKLSQEYDSDTSKTMTESSKSSISKGASNSTIRSPLWYELPLLFAIIGGLIAYSKIKKDDPVKARFCLIIGILITIPVAISLGIFLPFEISTGTIDPFYTVSTAAMEPNLHVSDIIVVNGNIPFDQLKLGDIIVFHASTEDKVIVSRVAEFISQNPEIIRTKGDANPGSISGIDFPITQGNYIGKVVYVLPQIGYLIIFKLPSIMNVVQIGIMIIPIVQHLKYCKKFKSS